MQAKKLGNRLSAKLNIYYLLDCAKQTEAGTENAEQTKTGTENLIYGSVTKIDGYLGSFAIDALINGKTTALGAKTANNKQKYFDIVINLLKADKLKLPVVAPFGYYAINKPEADTGLIDEINTLIGILDKPKFFQWERDICVHKRNEVSGCTRCIDACLAQAISSNGDGVNINPYLCHGCGNCVSVCQTGAVSYSYPNIEDDAKKMHALMEGYLAAGGRVGSQKSARLLLYSNNDDITQLQLADTDPSILPLALEEVAYLELSFFLYAFCLGFCEVFVYCNKQTPQTKAQLKRQIKLTCTILEGLSYKYKKPFIELINHQPTPQGTELVVLSKTIDQLNLANKRQRILAMVDFLYDHEQTTTQQTQCNFSPSDDVFFGKVAIDQSLCTLCMACVYVCPTKSLVSGDKDKPVINFWEHSCVQCTICAQSCPEDAITLESRLLYDKDQRTTSVMLNQDLPFSCRQCGKVFGSSMLIKKMQTELKNHSMFLGNKLANLELCEDCRVKALF